MERFSKGTHVLKFEASWCNPCKNMQPILEDLQAKGSLKDATLSKINADGDPLAQQSNIRSLPTLVVLKDGIETARYTGAASGASAIKSFLEGSP